MAKCSNCGDKVPDDISRTERPNLCAFCFLSSPEGLEYLRNTIPEQHLGQVKGKKGIL